MVINKYYIIIVYKSVFIYILNMIENKRYCFSESGFYTYHNTFQFFSIFLEMKRFHFSLWLSKIVNSIY